MVVFGACLLGVVPLRSSGLPVAAGPFAMMFFRRLFLSKHLAAKLSLGLVAGCLPCMLSLAMIVKAATTGRPFLGFLTMLSFGLGTLPALFFTGLSASLLSFRARLLSERVAAGMLIIMGFILILKGLKASGLV
jgi:sulfite exporter TauE/SafE